MAQFRKVSGVWRRVSMPYIKVSGVWKPVKALYRKVSGSWKSTFIQGGFVDKTFAEYDKIESGAHAYRGVATQSDEKTVLVGMSTWGGRQVGQVVRLNSDGSLDTAFSDNVGVGINSTSGYPKGVSVQSDGKILIFGWFSTWNGTATNNVVRLNSDGTRDTSFNPVLPVLTQATIGFEIEFVAFPQSDGKVIVSYHYYDPEYNEVTRTVRLNSNGTLDSSFNTNVGTGANGTVNSIAIQANGQILLGGFYQSWNGASVSNIVRLNSDGTRDTAFTNNTGSAANNSIASVATQSTGQIIVVGSFDTWNGATVNRIVRLNTNGTRDTAFNTNTGTASPSSVSFMKIQSDDKIILSGFIPTWNGTAVNHIVRLNSNGTRDTVFTTNTGTAASGGTDQVAIESSGKIIIASVTTWNNSPTIGHIRLNTDGSRDFSYGADYYSYTASQTVNASKTQADGKTIVVGQFTAWNGVTVNRIVRLNPDGTRDTAFNDNTGIAADATIKCIAIQSNGQILLGGDFGKWNATTVNGIVRLNSDGTRDTTFTTNVGSAANDEISAIAVQSNGQILVGGNFTTWKGVPTIRLVRLNSNGTLDTDFDNQSGVSANNEIRAIAVQSNGQILLGGYFDVFDFATASYVVRLNSNGSRDTTFSSNTANSLDGSVESIALQSDSKIVLGGSFTTWNGSAANNIVVLNTNGTRSTFSSGVSSSEYGSINSIAIQPNGQMVLGGIFTAWNGTAANKIIRVSSSGALDSAFNANIGTGPNEGVLNVDITPNGDIIVSGFFYTFNGSVRNRIVKLGGEPAL
jgi:uncharacterized delta-60 repeat protein